MIYALTVLYLAVIVFLEISHRKEYAKLCEKTGQCEEKKSRGRHFSPHRKAIEKFRRNEE